MVDGQTTDERDAGFVLDVAAIFDDLAVLFRLPGTSIELTDLNPSPSVGDDYRNEERPGP